MLKMILNGVESKSEMINHQKVAMVREEKEDIPLAQTDKMNYYKNCY